MSDATSRAHGQGANPGDGLWDTVIRLRDHVDALRQERLALQAEVQDLRAALAMKSIDVDPSPRDLPARSRAVPVETEVLMAAAQAGRPVGSHTAPFRGGSLHG